MSADLTTLVDFQSSGGGAVASNGNIFITQNHSLTELAAGSHTSTTIATSTTGQFDNLLFDAAGNLYGTLDSADSHAVFEVAAGTHTLTTVASLGGLNGTSADLCSDAAGNLYGLTYSADGKTDHIFEIVAATHQVDMLRTLPHADSRYYGDLIADASGNLFGTTGTTVFEIAAGTHGLKTLATFTTPAEAQPQGLTFDQLGNLFGSAGSTVFEIGARTERFSVLATLPDFIIQPPIIDAQGNVYVTSGTITSYLVELAAGTHRPSTLATFTGPNGSDPGYFIFDSAGDIFGTTASGGDTSKILEDADSGGGILYEVDARTHAFSTLVTFEGTNGSLPVGLYPEASGDIIGTTALGGTVSPGNAYGDGTLFDLSGSGFAVAPPAITVQPANEVGVGEHSVLFSAAANAGNASTVQWEVSSNRGATFSIVANNPTAKTTTLLLNNLSPSADGDEYRAVFTNPLGSVVTSAAKLSVVPLAFSSPAHASPSNVTGTSTTLSALADAAGDEPGLIYKWSIVRVPVGAARPTFSSNNSSAARHTIVTFHKDGRYVFRCTITDGLGDTVESDVQVEVTQQATSLRLTPHGKTITTGQNLTFHAAVYDQFGHPLRTQRPATYSVGSGPGTINSITGLFSSSTVGAALIEADDNSLSGTAGLQIIP